MKIQEVRAYRIVERLLEAYGGRSFHDLPSPPRVKNYQDFLDQVARLLWDDIHSIRPVQMLYAYFVKQGSEVAEQTLQDLGNVLMRNYGVSFDHTERMLNRIVRRLAVTGETRHLQRQYSLW